MRRVIKYNICFDIEVILVYDEEVVEASANPADYYIPNGEVISDMGKHDPQVLANYDAFVETIEDLLIDNYDLELTYYNDSDDNSRYYNFLARDEEGNVKIRFRLRLRVSNHDPHRSKQSQKKKKEELQSQELHKYASEDKLKKLRTITEIIIVNNEEYDSYEEAFIKIDEKIEHYLNVMLS